MLTIGDGQMKRTRYLLVPALVTLFAGCGGSPETAEDIEKRAFDDMRAEVREIIEDPQREETVVGLVDELQRQYSNLRDTTETRRKALQTLNAEYDATREQFVELLDKHNAEMESSHKTYLKSYRAFVEATTAEEWSALAKSNTKSMGQLAQSLSAI
jgi:TRAP-type mannitol/chloroaromatic compound transport system substrate-binding protein